MKYILSLILATGLALPVAGWSDQSHVIPDQWIVELESDATLQYHGPQAGSGAKLMAGGRALEATAPEGRRLDTSAPHVVAYAEFLDRERSDVLARAREQLGRDIRPRHVYRHVLNGFSVRLSETEARELEALPGVRRVTPDVAWRLETDRGPQVIGALPVWNDMADLSTRGEGVVIGVIDSGVNWDHRYFSDDPEHTGGYEYSNPLGGQLGECSSEEVRCNDKLIGVWDFTEEGTRGRDPDGEGHGTHVASIAAGNPWNFSLDGTDGTFSTSGVAPRANIVSYKVCYSEDYDDEDVAGRCSGSAITQALEQVVEDGVDVVNYSIGSDDALEPWQNLRAFLNIRAAGIMFVTSAGNNGPGTGTLTSPANAPWTLAVGSTSHGRRLGHRVDIAGLTELFVEPGLGPEVPHTITAPVIAADDAGSGLKGCEAYDSNALDGAIAFVSRGDCTFEQKVNLADDAGARAVLVYNDEPGASAIPMGGLETTSIPAVMLDNDQGEEALEAIRAMNNPQATLYGEQSRMVNSIWQDRVSDFSSRGPGSFAPDIMKPNVMAPGYQVLAGLVPDENSVGTSSGTSMASPHVAGAAALLIAMHPDWTPDMLQSALETTAEALPVRLDTRDANMIERGAGRIRVDRAARVGLYLPVTPSDFDDANPALGGDPAQLNLAGLYSGTCESNCQFTRTVEAIRSGSWTVEYEGDADIEVTPSSFSLSAGESQTLDIIASASGEGVDGLVSGAVVLRPADAELSTQRLPVSVTAAAKQPVEIDIEAQNTRGRESAELEVLAVLNEAVYRSSALTRPEAESFTLAQDWTPDDPFSGGTGTRTFEVEVPDDALMLRTDISSDSTRGELRLLVGNGGQGQPAADAVVCEQSTTDNGEASCRISTPEAGSWWIVVQNYEASSAQAHDSVSLEFAVLKEGGDYTLAAAGLPNHPGGALELAVAWDQPAMRRGERWMAAIGMASNEDELADAGVVPVTVTRTEALTPEATAIFPGETLPVVVPSEQRHDRLFFDVGPGADAVEVTVNGSADVTAELQRMPFDAVADHAPGTPPADGSVEDSSGNDSGSSITLSAAAAAGRWYVVLDNAGNDEALVDVSVSISESSPVMAQRGLWSPRDRVINQGIEWQQAGPGFMTWYSYDLDGLPVFYQAIGEIDNDASVWTAVLDRISNATGERQIYDPIGEVALTMLDDDKMVFAWRRDGFHGSEIMSPDASRRCPDDGTGPVSYSGHWYSPDVLAGGTTMIVTDEVQAHVRYYFDVDGVGRWLLASDPESDPFNEVLELLDYRGFCPGCAETELEIHTVGVYERTFDSEQSGTERLEFTTAEPLEHVFEIEVPISKLSESMECR
ncbi:S8 family serine peptidase [Wenzhouxiangella sp. AB-CW3]|uniref:S8 family serine peptidase n=1 Tax=Wenzhouxiangella sp. AB-CW3 TaxID=2771012 RepID=UPI00168BAEEC|nr:S8 family serine peptidase [Wenzhouxiangella sp. AB-CW3]QOC21370.1 S8 family serine peptidase [Wenzhouxiangella sp. AB-CW3]